MRGIKISNDMPDNGICYKIYQGIQIDEKNPSSTFTVEYRLTLFYILADLQEIYWIDWNNWVSIFCVAFREPGRT